MVQTTPASESNTKTTTAITDSKRAPISIKPKGGAKRLVVKRGRGVPQAGLRTSLKRPLKSAGGGLPTRGTKTFQSAPDQHDPEEEKDEFGFEELDTSVSNHSDALLAIQSLKVSSQGLHIPLQNGSTVQAVLESQLFRRFDSNHASMINTELRDLYRKNHYVELDCRDHHAVALLSTPDYVAGVWDALHHANAEDPTEDRQMQHQAVVSWFVDSLPNLDKKCITKDQLEAHWKHKLVEGTDASLITRGSLDNMIQILLQLQVLMRLDEHHTYQLWLPNWGLVLKGWSEARQQLLSHLKMKKELSERNLMSQNRHSCISTKFLLDELQRKGTVRIVTRPFGKFVQCVKET
jgi:hypothetical protein